MPLRPNDHYDISRETDYDAWTDRRRFVKYIERVSMKYAQWIDVVMSDNCALNC